MSKSILEDPEYLRYVREIQRHDLLTPEEERELARKARAGDRSAEERLVTANLRFVVKVALQYRGYGLRALDLIQEGNLGLMQAVEKFDPERGFRLVTYAVHWIRAYIRAYILKQWSMVRVGTTHAERRLFYRLPKAKRELGELANGDPNEVLAILANQLNATEEQVRSAEQRVYGRDMSLATPLAATEGDRTLEDVLPDLGPDQDEVVTAQVEQDALRGAIDKALADLGEREQYIIRRRFLADEKVTLQEIGDELGLSRERVRQLEALAKERIGKLLKRDTPELVAEALA
ncbi:MAG: RNA polymerase factor sigma-32 [Deltaproteobacteria bacterium]|nr:RNA polymerase factor sigma-32 [Deltaproteobacteria bacterium]